MRVLLATEGPSDEITAEAIISFAWPNAQIDPKRFPARGIAIIERSVENVVRAAHFGHYDMLVLHADMDNTLSSGFRHVSESSRWADLSAKIDSCLGSLPPASREQPLIAVLMAPVPTTDAWLAWGRDNKDGPAWESKERHHLKQLIFGTPPRSITKTTAALADVLIEQLKANEDWPISLRSFVDGLQTPPDA